MELRRVSGRDEIDHQNYVQPRLVFYSLTRSATLMSLNLFFRLLFLVFGQALRPGSARGPLQGCSVPRCLLLSFISCLTSTTSLSLFVLLALIRST